MKLSLNDAGINISVPTTSKGLFQTAGVLIAVGCLVAWFVEK